MNWPEPAIHAGKEIFVFGKGPGFHDVIKQKTIGDIRICINETVLHVPDPTYVITLNEATWSGLLPAFQTTNVIALVEREQLKHVRGLGVPDDRIIEFTRCEKEEYLFKWSREELRRSKYLYGNMGSAVPAVHWAWYIGAFSRINFAGFDGGVQYAPEFDSQKPSIYNDAIWQKVCHTCDGLMVEAALWTETVEEKPTPVLEPAPIPSADTAPTPVLESESTPQTAEIPVLTQSETAPRAAKAKLPPKKPSPKPPGRKTPSESKVQQGIPVA